MSAKVNRLRRRLEISESQVAKLVRLIKLNDEKEISKVAKRLAQATLRAWNAGQAFGDGYFKDGEGKQIVTKVGVALEAELRTRFK